MCKVFVFFLVFVVVVVVLIFLLVCVLGGLLVLGCML